MSTISDHAAAEALKSQSVTVDGQMITRRTLKELIELDQYSEGKAAATTKKPGFGLRFQQIVPGGGG